jgi:hypothetical protein
MLDTIWAALRSPGGKAVLLRVAQQILEGKRDYQRMHWGRQGQGATTIDVSAARPFVQLGALTRVGYVTLKGVDREPTEYVHTFRVALPLLYVTSDGELSIVRGRSKYKITSHGIVG